MVTYRYLSDKFLKPRQDAPRDKRPKEGPKEPWKEDWKDGWRAGWREGLCEGREQEQRRWVAWNARRVDAERNGQPFDEPPPGLSNSQDQTTKE